MSDKSPRQSQSKKSGKSIKEKRAIKKAKRGDDTQGGVSFPAPFRVGRDSGIAL